MRRKRTDLEDLSGPVVSAIDTFGGALGAALAMLLVLSVVNRTPMQRQGAGARTPVVLTIQWSDAHPDSGGLGPGLLEVRVVNTGEEARPLVTGMGRDPRKKPSWASSSWGSTKPDWASEWDIVPVEVGGRWKSTVGDETEDAEPGKQQALPDVSVMCTTLTASSLRPGGSWRVEVRATWDDFAGWATNTPEYRDMLNRVNGTRGRYQSGSITAAALRDQVRAETGNYLAYAENLAAFAHGWNRWETKWLDTPVADRDRGWVAEGVVERARAVEKLLKKASSWKYAGGFDRLKPGDGTTPCPVTLDGEVSALVALEYPPIPDRAMNSETLRRFRARNLFRVVYARALETVLADGFSAPVELTVHAPGMKSLTNGKYVLDDLFPAGETGGWVTVGTLSSDVRGVARFTPSLPPQKASPPRAAAAPDPVPTSRWELATRRYHELDGKDAGGDPILDRVDRALDYLAKNIDRDGGATDGMLKFTETVKYPGPGTTGIGLLAFTARGHEVGVPSRHADTVNRMVNFMIRRVDEGHYGDPATPRDGGQPGGYQLGFTLIALTDAIPGAERADPVLAAKMRAAIEKAVAFAISKQQPSGGWGYFTPYSATREDSSVTVVLVKGLHGVLQVLRAGDKELRAGVEAAVGKGVGYVNKCRNEKLTVPGGTGPVKGYAYQASESSYGVYRQPGCLLSEVLGAGRRSFRPKDDPFHEAVFDGARSWSEKLTRAEIVNGANEFYALFYAAHLVALWEDATARDRWFAMIRQKMKDVGQSEADGSFPGTYGTAMTLIQLELPLRVSRQELPPAKKP